MVVKDRMTGQEIGSEGRKVQGYNIEGKRKSCYFIGGPPYTISIFSQLSCILPTAVHWKFRCEFSLHHDKICYCIWCLTE